ncbi:lipopolysaccharide assembly protein LapB [Thioalkalicoccus limnaeus]|uniref:Lipopolysaccharide assembly protein B n=1 Tax=Thioalkalicoccus limnaeus TaxID=120681 RepID=A0ABV4BGQ7_9GAMM
MTELLFLLLPIAAASGWFAARRSERAKVAAAPQIGHPSFFRGLNYLLDEQPDKAIDVFVKLAEVDQETVEVHLALGSLFRRRGEVDRAIRIHQNLVARDNLEPEQRGFALYELGQDYMRAGLFDRAERLFGELLELGLQRRRALEALAEIYQQEREWVRGLEVAEQLEALGVESVRTAMAHYRCELAEQAFEAGEIERAEAHLEAARSSDRRCVRASMLQGEILMRRGDYARALVLYRGIVRQDPSFMPEILPQFVTSLERGGQTDLRAELESLYLGRPNPMLLVALAERVREQQGDEAAVELLRTHLTQYADLAGLVRFLEWQGDQDAADAIDVTLVIVRHLAARLPAYQCQNCGFTARHIHWQCPSCKRWDTVRLLQPEPLGTAAWCAPAVAADKSPA